jgi:Fe-S-cluster containining protein
MLSDSKLGVNLPVLNLASARFECTFGKSCEGTCCRNGRPLIYPEEAARIDAKLPGILPALRPEARVIVETMGYLSRRRKRGQPLVRVSKGWCVFFNQGCVLHRIGAAEGDSSRYKPAACALFPLARDERDQWYVRQRGFQAEVWDLFCLDPNASDVPASESLRDEIALAQRFAAEESSGTGSCSGAS